VSPTSHVITLRLFLGIYGCNATLSQYVFGAKKIAAKQDQLAANCLREKGGRSAHTKECVLKSTVALSLDTAGL
jgi:hypothetical protein